MTVSKSYYIETYGCEMNKSDSVDIALELEGRGYKQVDDERKADVVILNTCAVRGNAEERVVGRLGHFRSLERRCKGRPIIVLAGCMAQEKGRDLFDVFPEIRIVAGTYHGMDIPQYVEDYKAGSKPVVALTQEDFRFSAFTGERAEGYKAWVNVIKGCSNYCSYCIVPHLRGPEKSKESRNILYEIEKLAAKGVVEITLLGQNVNAYGRDNGDISFVSLLEKINNLAGIQWVRFLTSHPKDFSAEMVKKIAELEKVCKHFHLPLQSGSDRILALMNREYTVLHYMDLIEAIRKYTPSASITTDIIVGFPSESGEDFQRTLDVVRMCRFDDAFTYRYSERPFTSALEISEKIDPAISSQRLTELIELQRGFTREKNLSEIGSRRAVLVERPSKKNPFEFLCKSETGKMIVVDTRAPIGTFIEVLVKNISGSTLRAVEVA